MIRTIAQPRPFARLSTSWFLDTLALHRQRRALSRLDDHLLRDVGISRAEAEAEAFRAPWNAPVRKG